MSFCPIDGIGFVQRTIVKARPVAVRRARGVDLDDYRQSELEEMLSAGPLGSPSALLAERRIQEARGGVLPKNWITAKRQKANTDLMASIRLGARY